MKLYKLYPDINNQYDMDKNALQKITYKLSFI